MGQVQSVEEATIGSESAEAAPRCTTQAEESRVTTADDGGPATATSTREESPTDGAAEPLSAPTQVPDVQAQETPSKTAFPPPVEMGDIAAKAGSGRRVARKAEGFVGNPPASTARPRSREQRGEREGRPRTRRHRRPRIARTSTPVALMFPGALVTPDEPAPPAQPAQPDPPAPPAPPSPTDVILPDVPSSGDVEMAAGHVAPRATIVAGGSLLWRAACIVTVLGCFVAVVAMLAYGTVKSIEHQDRVIEDFDNWTLVRLGRPAAPVAVSTTAVTAAKSTSGGLTFEEDESSNGAANRTQSVPRV